MVVLAHPLKAKILCRPTTHRPTPSSRTTRLPMRGSGTGQTLPLPGAVLQLGSCRRQFSKKRTILMYDFPVLLSWFSQ